MLWWATRAPVRRVSCGGSTPYYRRNLTDGQDLQGSTVSDFDEDEKSRQLSINTALIPIEFQDYKLNLLDTPGYTDFQGEAKNAVRVCDCVLVAVDAVAGPEVGTELAWQFADEFNQPLIVVINKINRENASFQRTLDAMRTRFPDYKFIPVLLPVGEGPAFKGVINVLTQKAYYGTGADRTEPPAEMADDITAAHLALVEAAAESSEELMNKYFETEELSFDEIRDGIRAAARDAKSENSPRVCRCGRGKYRDSSAPRSADRLCLTAVTAPCCPGWRS